MIQLTPGLGITGLPLEAYEAGTGEYLGAVASEAFSTLPVPSIMRYAERFGASGEDPAMLAGGLGYVPREAFSERARDPAERERGLSRELTAEEANARFGNLGLKFTAPVRERVAELLAERKRELMAYHSVFDRARANGDLGIVKGGLSVATDFLTGLADPLNVAAMFFPVVGPTRYAMWQARMGLGGASLVKGGVEGAVGTALLEPFNAVLALDEQQKYGPAETLANLAIGTLAGGGLHWLVGRLFGERDVRGALPAEPRAGDAPILDRVAAALLSPEPEAVVPRPRENAVPAARREGPAAEHQPMAAAIEALQPETKEAALKTAVAQVLQEKRPDVEPVLKADPAWRPPIAAAYEGPAARARETRVDFNQIRRDMLAAEADVERLRAGAAEVNALAGAGAGDRGRPFAVPAEFKPSFKELNEARKFQAAARRGAGPEPMRLMEYLARVGISPSEFHLGDLKALGITEATKIKGKRVIREGGKRLSDISEALTEMGAFTQQTIEHNPGAGGFVSGKQSRIKDDFTTSRLLEAIGEDFSGNRPFYMDPHEGAAWRQAVDALERDPAAQTIAGQPIAGLAPREVAFLLRQDLLSRRVIELEDKMARGEITEAEALERAGELDRAMADAFAAEWEEVKARWNEYTRELDPELVPEHPGEYVGQRPEEFDAIERSIRDHERSLEQSRAAPDAGRSTGGRDQPPGAHGEAGDAARGPGQSAADAGAQPGAAKSALEAPRFDEARIALEARISPAELEAFGRRQQDPAGDFAGPRDPVFDAAGQEARSSASPEARAARDLAELQKQTAELEAQLKDRITDLDRAAINETARAADDYARAGEAYLACKAED